MAMRRPRIKAQANIQLNSKRKSKIADATKSKSGESNVGITTNVTTPSPPTGIAKEVENNTTEEPKTQESNSTISDDGKIEDVSTEKEVKSSTTSTNASDTTASDNNLICGDVKSGSGDKIEKNVKKGGVNSDEESINRPKAGSDTMKDELNDKVAFKCPPKVEYQRSTSHVSNNGTDDVFYSDIEENALQMDLQKSPNDFPMSPSKNQQAARQRIKATPIFGQRRNSFVSSSPSPHTTGSDDNPSNSYNDFAVPSPRRERHISGSMSTNSNSSSSSHPHHTPHKYLPNGVVNAGMGRVRTESGCSVFSDTNVSSQKSRRTDEHKHNLKRDFEARFGNGVPDKSALKMSDLIFYNPVTNPMEQKPNPNIKLENGDKTSTSGEIKPFKEKQENDAEKDDTESEAMPVPQLKLNSNGELILDDKSLVIETTAEQEARKVLANSSLIYLDENTGMNGFYSRQKRTRDWPSTETIKFYRCLQTVGTDFSLMVPLFPNRTRRDLKLKFKKEERINGHLINKALLYPKNFNIEELKQQIEEEDKKREEEAERYKQMKEAAAKEVKKRKNVRSRADCALKGDNIYQNENQQKPKKSRKLQPKVTKEIAIEVAPTPAQNEETVTSTIEMAVIAAVHTEENTNIPNNKIIKTENDKVKRRRRPYIKKVPNIKKETTTVAQKKEHVPTQEQVVLSSSPPPLSPPIKVEIIKNEPVHMPLFTTKTEKTEIYNDDGDQLEDDIDQLLHSDAMDMDNTESMPLPPTTDKPPLSPFVPMTESPIISDSSSSSSSSSSVLVIDDNYCDEPMDIENCYEGRTFVNLDDGSVTTINNVNQQPHMPSPEPADVYSEQKMINQPTPSPSPPSLQTIQSLPPQPQEDLHYIPPPSPQMSSASMTMVQPPDLNCTDTCSSIASERELNEQDIQHILTELAEGSLVLVSTLDPEDPDKVLNEIFMVDKNTGDLCDEPLNIPDNIVQCILSVMS